MLLTGKMDRNLVYREDLKNTTGDGDLDSLNFTIAIISITIPVVGGNILTDVYCRLSLFRNKRFMLDEMI